MKDYFSKISMIMYKNNRLDHGDKYKILPVKIPRNYEKFSCKSCKGRNIGDIL